MPYQDRFIATDALIVHLQPVVVAIADEEIKANYAGFLSVSAVTVYELAIKDIFNEFAVKKNKIFGKFVENHFSRINGRIKIKDLKDQHIQLFGDKYFNRFRAILDKKDNNLIPILGNSVKSSYSNLIECRHQYVHQGSPTLTIDEVISSYNSGKEVIHCLDNAMKR